jgi:hypothetical protein
MGARLIRIAISQAAFDAIAKTLSLGSVGFENKVNEKLLGRHSHAGFRDLTVRRASCGG